MIDKDGTETRRYGPPVSREEFEELAKRVSELAFEIGAMAEHPSYVYTAPSRQQGKSWLYERYMQAKRGEQPQPDSDGWRPWHGGECPVSPDNLVDYKERNGCTFSERAAALRWQHDGDDGDIIAYRPAKQEAEWPKQGDEYWYIDITGEVVGNFWSGGTTDIDTRTFTGIYPTREQAEEAAGKIKRIMDHLRSGEQVILATDTRMITAEKVEL